MTTQLQPGWKIEYQTEAMPAPAMARVAAARPLVNYAVGPDLRIRLIPSTAFVRVVDQNPAAECVAKVAEIWEEYTSRHSTEKAPELRTRYHAPCAYCHEPLTDADAGQRKYHVRCKPLVDAKAHRERMARNRQERKTTLGCAHQAGGICTACRAVILAVIATPVATVQEPRCCLCGCKLSGSHLRRWCGACKPLSVAVARREYQKRNGGK
jgi:hypothetical protein